MSSKTPIEETMPPLRRSDYPTGKFDYDAWRDGKGPTSDEDADEQKKKQMIRPKRRSFKAYVQEMRVNHKEET